MTSIPDLDQLNPEQLRAVAAQLLQRVSVLDEQVETMGMRAFSDSSLRCQNFHGVPAQTRNSPTSC